jgi:hypothetical protein
MPNSQSEKILSKTRLLEVLKTKQNGLPPIAFACALLLGMAFNGRRYGHGTIFNATT